MKITPIPMVPVVTLAAMLVLMIQPSAKAATRQAKNRCSDAVRILRSNPSMYYKDRDVEATAVGNANTHYNQVIEGWNRASAQLNQIPPAELDKTDPELQECVEVVTSWGDYIRMLRGKIEGAEALGKSVLPFLAEVKGKDHALFTLLAVQFDKHADVLNDMKPEAAKQLLSELAAIEKSCNTHVPEAGQTPPGSAKVGSGAGSEHRSGGVAMSTELAKNPNVWCYVAKQRNELMTVAAANRFVFVEGYGNYALILTEMVEKISAERPDMDAWLAEILLDPKTFLNKRTATSQGWYKSVGLPVPADGGNGPIEAQLKVIQSKVDEAAPQVKFPRQGPHDSGLEKQAGAALKKLFPKAVYKGGVMDSEAWTITKNGLGVPLDRYRSGKIMFKRPGSQWCEQRTFTYAETYTGGGRFARGEGVKILSAVRFISCD